MFKKSYFVLYEYQKDGYIRKGNAVYTTGLFDKIDLNKISDKLGYELGATPLIIGFNSI